MQIKVDEISKLIRAQIEDFEKKTDLSEVGTVITVGDGIGRIYGLEKVMAGELLELPHGVMGLALRLFSLPKVIFGCFAWMIRGLSD